ncbi:long-chain acyl-CoA synthetase [Natronocella acetinitrilica]|uniref:Long-chain-fatty-acid--CoA ligase n=1 Tax=Natronocella acetinitrilica TaxID=414046 RepID=A0AAE3G2Q7_9GAMM|nr:AMP-binding protein [Natronocella acetinitrilica]MCP1674078.1 long-chain acyl-CoA synthetase [Natronocella acetinitrilica]
MDDTIRQAQAFYDSRPWLAHYGEGIDTELNALPDQTLVGLMQRACEQYRERVAFTICLDNGLHASYSYGDIDRLSDQFAAYLSEELKLRPGDRVAVQMPNCLAYPVAVFGILKAGLVLVNFNPLYTAREMNLQLKDCGARVLLLIDLFADKLGEGLRDTDVEHVLLASVATGFPWLKRTLIRTVLRLKKQIPTPTAQTQSLENALSQGANLLKAGRFSPVERATDDLAVLQYTGGTTGVAKGAMLSHGNLLANLAQIQQVAGPVIRPGNEVILTALPLYHIFAFSFNMMTFFMNGCRNVLCPSPRPPSNLRKAFETFPVTKFSGVNVLFHALCHEDWFRGKPPAIDMTISGGTALHASVAKEWKELVGSELCEGYGLSETSPVVSVNQPTGRIVLGSIGLPVPGTDVRIVNDEGAPVPQGEAGELAVRGPQVFSGYWNRDDETAQALRDGWFLTGDVATMDADGYIRIVDRKKDMIDVSGFNVYPNEVEEVLDGHPGVAEVAVIGVPGKNGGETVRAYVVRKDPSLTEQALIAYGKEHLTNYKVPREVVFRDELPKTPVGKILRKDLRKEATAET